MWRKEGKHGEIRKRKRGEKEKGQEKEEEKEGEKKEDDDDEEAEEQARRTRFMNLLLLRQFLVELRAEGRQLFLGFDVIGQFLCVHLRI